MLCLRVRAYLWEAGVGRRLAVWCERRGGYIGGSGSGGVSNSGGDGGGGGSFTLLPQQFSE
jgi:hypothetical protein